MSSVQRLVKNTISILIARGLQPILSLVLVLFIGRILGPELFGKYTIVFQLFFIFQITSSFGLRILLTREVAANKQDVSKYLSNGIFLSLPTAIINVLAMVILGKLMHYDAETTLGIYIISISLATSALTDIFSGVLAGVEEINKIAYGWMIFLVVKTVASIAVLFMGFGLIALIVIHVIAKFIHAAVTYYFIIKGVTLPEMRIDIELCKKLLRMAWSLALLIICISLYWRIDTLMLSKMSTNEVVSNYGAAFKIFWFAILSVQSFFTAFFPMISSMYATNPANFRMACNKAIRFLTIFIFPILVLTTFLSPQLMPLIWGIKFQSSALILQIMIWALWPFAITEVFGSALVASKNQVIQLLSYVFILIVKVVLNYYLIQKYDANGAAAATVVSMFILMAVQVPFVVPKLIKFRVMTVISPLVKLIIASAIIAAGLYYFNSIHIVFKILIPTIVYLLMLLTLKVFSENDKLYFRKLLKKKA